MRNNLKLGVILAINFAICHGQGYGNVEDDSPPAPQNSQQMISSLPQYDPDPELSGDGYSAPSNSQRNPAPNADQSESQDYWWLNQNAFQQPPGHPGVEPSDNKAAPVAPQPQPQQRPTPQQNNRSPNAYNPPNPSQNAFKSPHKPYKPQPQPQPNNQFQQLRPNPQSNRGGWNDPQSPQAQAPAQSTGFNLPPPANSLAQPDNDFAQDSPVATPECKLLNKADCHNGRRPAQSDNLQQNLPSNDYDQEQGYNVPKPPQNYRPPQPQQPRPQPQQPPQQPPPQDAPAQFYQPPPQQELNPFQSRPQNPPSNQNYQPSQYSSDYQPSSSPVQNNRQSSRPNSNYQPQPQQQQQQYNRPQPQQSRPFNNNQQYQNNAQAYRPQPQSPQNPQPQQQPPTNYNDQVQAPYPGCPAAMLCVQDDQCNLIGTIEENLRLSPADKAHRVALSTCSEPSTGIEGVCCRDPNYKDPWPDMQGMGMDKSGQHHHQNKGQGQSNQQYQLQQQPPASFRNPYSDFGQRKLTNSPVVLQPEASNQEPRYQSCPRNEACVINYKCFNGYVTASQGENKVYFNHNHPHTQNSSLTKCKEDVFKNAYVCCKHEPITTTTTYRPIFSSSTTTTTRRPIQQVPKNIPQSGHITTNNGRFSSTFSTTTREPIYKNNYLLTNTLAHESTTQTSFSPLISGVGLRFHSQLHTKSAIEADRLKPNSYSDDEPAIIVRLVSKAPTTTIRPSTTSTTTTTTEVSTTTRRATTKSPILESIVNHKNTNGNTNSIELEGADTRPNLRFTNGNGTTLTSQEKNITSPQTDNLTNTDINTTIEITNYDYKPSVKEILQNFWRLDNNLEDNTTFTKVDVNKVPKPVRLRQEFVENPPFGFIFNGSDLFIPELVRPAQNFRPPTFEYGQRQYSIPEDFPSNTEDEMGETTTLLPQMEDESLGEDGE